MRLSSSGKNRYLSIKTGAMSHVVLFMKVCCSDVANNNSIVFYSIGDDNRSMIELYIKDRGGTQEL